MAKQVNPSKSQKPEKTPAGEKVIKPPLVTPLASVKIQTECLGGAMCYTDGETVYLDSVTMQILLRTAKPRLNHNLPFQPVTFYIWRQNATNLFKTVSSKTDATGCCSEVVRNLPCDPNFLPEGEYYTFKGEYKGNQIYGSSSWTRQHWVSPGTTSF
ncbi:MAG: hypothetical protein MUO17_00865 [Dehalococcoidales bacterium]|nr:hypothetical protein [Dehalococcoidales bacterium]